MNHLFKLVHQHLLTVAMLQGHKLKLLVEEAMDGSKSPLPGFAAKTLQITIGNGEVCDALECAKGQIKKGEKAFLTVQVSFPVASGTQNRLALLA